MSSASMLEPTALPVRLVCPDCGETLRREACSCPRRNRLDFVGPIPRTYFGTGDDDISAETWNRLVEQVEHRPWLDAVREVLGEEEAQHQSYHLGAELLHGLAWHRIRDVLEVGSGLGEVTTLLAALAPNVVAVDWLPQRAEFVRRRIEQTRGTVAFGPPLNGVASVIANPLEVPFAAGSFDLVTLHGLFGDSERLQQEFLEQLCRLLRPGGCLYLATHTRPSLVGRLARWKCTKPKSAPATATEPRGPLHTPEGYERMLRQAGFVTVEAHGLFPGYRHQKASFPLNHRAARQTVLDLVDPPASTLGALGRRIANRLPHSGNEVVLVASRAPAPERLLWAECDGSTEMAQFSTATKISLLDFAAGRPNRLTRVVKVGNDPERLVREYRFLETAEKLLAGETPTLRLRWPRPLGNECKHGRQFFHFEYVEGPTLAQLLVPRNYRPLPFRDLVTQLVNGYLDLSERLTARWSREADTVPCLDSLGRVDLGGELAGHLAQACDRARRNHWPTQMMHGDLTLNNAIVTANGQLVLIDWENYSTHGLAAIDLMRLLFDAWTEKKLYASWLGDDFLGHVRAAVRAGLARLQLGPADYADLALLFLAHQAQFDRTRDCAIDEMLNAYLQHALDLST